ncbi:MAG: tRNA (adenosine(37)-N6)-dimethylallyltransferase MiaA [bacterium]
MIIVITGPTCVGKTKLSEHLAKKIDAIIINADAVQVYKELNIGSAKPIKEEMSNQEHYLFDEKNITEDYTVFDYQKDIRKLLELNKDKNIIIVGGTGLYISAGLYDYQFEENLEKDEYENLTNDELYKLALEKDSKIDIHPNNRVRLVNFLNQTIKSTDGKNLLYEAKFIGLTTSRDILYEKINNRVDEMFEKGLLKEVELLYNKKDDSRVLNSAIGYKEVIQYLNKETSYEEMIEIIKQNSRRYAKRQYTWFNNKMNLEWFEVNYECFNNTIEQVEEYLGVN